MRNVCEEYNSCSHRHHAYSSLKVYNSTQNLNLDVSSRTQAYQTQQNPLNDNHPNSSSPDNVPHLDITEINSAVINKDSNSVCIISNTQGDAMGVNMMSQDINRVDINSLSTRTQSGLQVPNSTDPNHDSSRTQSGFLYITVNPSPKINGAVINHERSSVCIKAISNTHGDEMRVNSVAMAQDISSVDINGLSIKHSNTQDRPPSHYRTQSTQKLSSSPHNTIPPPSPHNTIPPLDVAAMDIGKCKGIKHWMKKAQI